MSTSGEKGLPRNKRLSAAPDTAAAFSFTHQEALSNGFTTRALERRVRERLGQTGDARVEPAARALQASTQAAHTGSDCSHAPETASRALQASQHCGASSVS